MLSNNSLHQLRQETKTRHWAIVLEVVSGQRNLFNEGGDNRSFESTWERAINERVIYQLGNRREEYIKTVLKEECWYGVQWARFSRRLFDAGLKVLKAGGTDSGASLNEPEVGKVSLILLILLVKKEANVSARLFSEE